MLLSGTAGATTATVTGSGALYNVAVSGMTGSGTVIATIPASVATGDITGFPNAASVSIDNEVTFNLVVGPIITTIAGDGSPCSPTTGICGDGGLATAAQISQATQVAVDPFGNLFISTGAGRRIRKVDAGSLICTVAGSGVAGFSGDGGPATSADTNNVRGGDLEAAGNLYFADVGNHRIRRVDAITGIITTVAGTGTGGFSGDGGQATSAQILEPSDVAVDAAGNLFIADNLNHRVRRVDAITGVITTVAGTGTQGFSGDGGPATSANLSNPFGVAVDSAGDLFIADATNNRVRKVTGLAASGVRHFTDQLHCRLQRECLGLHHRRRATERHGGRDHRHRHRQRRALQRRGLRMTGPGTVIATIPASVATGDITGLPNAASVSIDNQVDFN